MEAISPTEIFGTKPAAPTGRNLAELDSEAFFEMLITQLQTQDPLDPVSNSDVVAQISQIRDLESSTKLSATLDKLAEMQSLVASQQQFGSASSLIGSYVEGAVATEDGSGRFISGVVTGIRFEADGTPILETHNGEELPIGSLSQVTNVEELNRLANKLINELIRGEIPDESGLPIDVRGIVDSVKTDEIGLPILVLDDGTEMPLQYFREILSENDA